VILATDPLFPTLLSYQVKKRKEAYEKIKKSEEQIQSEERRVKPPLPVYQGNKIDVTI
jgi:hypothetical protein